MANHAPTLPLGPLADTILAELRAEVRAMPAGTRLPSENACCARFCASRPTVRRALRVLLDEGLISVRQGAGAFATGERSAAKSSQAISLMVTPGWTGLDAAQEIALRAGHLCCLYAQSEHGWRPDLERAFLERVRAERHRGLLALCTPHGRNQDLLQAMEEEGIRIVHLGPATVEDPAQPYIMPDYRLAGHAAANELLLAGCTRLVFARMDPPAPYELQLQAGWQQALEAHGTGWDKQRDLLVFQSNAHADGPARQAVADWLCRLGGGRVGVFARSQDLAATLHELAGDIGRSIPADLAVLAVDEDGEPSRPVDGLVYDHAGMLVEALRAVLAPVWRPPHRLVPHRLVRRGSLRPA
jgi:DNA-binding LacI/PurR family transcriptional regulator